MAIQKKPATPAAAPAANVQALDQFINRGGSIPADKAQPQPKAELRLPIRMPSQEFRDRIDRARTAKGTNTSATQWVLTAIAEKLDRDGF